MTSTLQIKESSVTPAGTQALYLREDPDKLRAFLARDLATDAELTLGNCDLPSAVQFGMITDPRIQVIQGIPVDIRKEGEIYVASWDEAEEFGYGATRSEALEDFGRTIVQLFLTLNREKDTLGNALLATLTLLSNHLQLRG